MNLGKYLAQILLEDFPLLNEYSESTIKKLIDKFKTTRIPGGSLYDAKIRKYIEAFEKIKDKLPVEKRDIFQYSWEELEDVLSNYYEPKRIKVGKLNKADVSNAELVYNQNGLRIYAGTSKESCVKYGNGYSFCISARGEDNMYNNYRYPAGMPGKNRGSFIGTPYFIFDDTKSFEQNEDWTSVDPTHLLVLFHNTEYEGDYDEDAEYEEIDTPYKYTVTEADNEGEEKYSDFKSIEQDYPRLKGLKDIFEPINPSDKEINERILFSEYIEKISNIRKLPISLVLPTGWAKSPGVLYQAVKQIKTQGKIFKVIPGTQDKPLDTPYYFINNKDNDTNNNSSYSEEYVNIKDIPGLENTLNSLEYHSDYYRKKLLKLRLMTEDLKSKSQRLTESETGTIGEFVKFAIKNLQISQPPSGLTLSYDTNQATEKRSFGYFDPNNNKIWIYCKNRNMADVLRTLAHELVHHKQNEDGRIEYESGKTGSDIENEANAKAGVLLRDFGKLYSNIYDQLIQEGLYGDFLFGDKETGVKAGWYDQEMEEDTPFEKKIFQLFKKYGSSSEDVYSQINLDSFLPILIQLKKDYPAIMDPYSKYARHGIQFEGDLSPDDYIYRGTGLPTKIVQNMVQKEGIENIPLYKGPNGNVIQGLLTSDQVYSSKRKVSSWSTDYYNGFHFAMKSKGDSTPVVMRAKAKDANLFFSKRFLEKISGYPEEEMLNSTNPMPVDIIILDRAWAEEPPSDSDIKDEDEIKSIFIKNLGL